MIPLPSSEARQFEVPGTEAEPTEGRLLFRRQFIIGPGVVAPALLKWQQVDIRPSMVLAAHPDLPVRRIVEDERSVTLLGFVLDPRDPEANDEQILVRMMRNLKTFGSWEALVRSTDDFSGRWILIVDAGTWVRLFSDPCGYRQAFYTRPRPGEVWCASQPGLLSELLDLAPSVAAQRFIEEFREKGSHGWPAGQHWWPGDSSLYDEVRHVLPNHYLDLCTGETRRFWPAEVPQPFTYEDALEQNADLLVGIVKSAANRYPLALTLTAGRDTRLLLAATRGITDRVFYFTLTYWGRGESIVDIAIARRVAAKLRIPHQVITCPQVMEPWFERVYSRNVTSAHEVYGSIAQGLYDRYPPDDVCMKGNAMHIVRGYTQFRTAHLPPGRKIDAALLLLFGKIPEHPFALEAMERWLEDTGPSCPIDLLNLFIWENKEGNWQAMSQLEWDIVQEVLVPFNCRSFLLNALSVDLKYRTWPEHTYQRRLTAMLWPRVLSEPINPPWPSNMLRLHVREWLIQTGIIRYVREARRLASIRRAPPGPR